MTVIKKCDRCRRDKQKCERPEIPNTEGQHIRCNRCSKYGYDCSEDLAPGETPLQLLQNMRLPTSEPNERATTPAPEILSQPPPLTTDIPGEHEAVSEEVLQFSGLSHARSMISNLPSTSQVQPIGLLSGDSFPTSQSSLAVPSPSLSTGLSQFLPVATSSNKDTPVPSHFSHIDVPITGVDRTIPVPFPFHANSQNGRDRDFFANDGLGAQIGSVKGSMAEYIDICYHLHGLNIEYVLGGDVERGHKLKMREQSPLEITFEFVKTIEYVPSDTRGLMQLWYILERHILREGKLPQTRSGETTILHDIFASLGTSTFPALQWMIKETRLVAALGRCAISSDFTVQNKTGATPLHAANIPHLFLESLLQEHREAISKAVNTQDSEGRLPLHFDQDDLKTFELFVELLQVKSLESPCQSTPLSILFIVEQENEFHKRFFWEREKIGGIEKKLNILHRHHIFKCLSNQPYKKEPNILHYLVKSYEYPGSVRLLLRGPNKIGVECANEHGKTPLLIATENALELSYLSFCKRLAASLSNIYSLIIYGNANVNKADNYGFTPALEVLNYVTNRLDVITSSSMLNHLVLMWTSITLMKLFIRNGANLDIEVPYRYGLSARKISEEAWDRWNRSLILDRHWYQDSLDKGRKIYKKIQRTLCCSEDIYDFGMNFYESHRTLKNSTLDDTIDFLKRQLRTFVEMISQAPAPNSDKEEGHGIQSLSTPSRKRKLDSISSGQDSREEEHESGNDK